jgi:hypothetical protein
MITQQKFTENKIINYKKDLSEKMAGINKKYLF